MEINKLDKPTWHSLSETHKDFAIDYGDVKFYHPDYCPFGSLVNPGRTETGISLYATLTNNFFIVGIKPNINEKVRLNNELVCNQMVLDKQIDIEIDEHIIELQTEYQKADFNKLVAITGERMKMNKFTELSAIVKHLNILGKATPSN